MSGPHTPCSHGGRGDLHREYLEIPRALADGLAVLLRLEQTARRGEEGSLNP